MAVKKKSSESSRQQSPGQHAVQHSLSSHDINIISLVAQGPKIPEDMIRGVIASKDFGVSKPASEIVTIILDMKSGRAKTFAASDWKAKIAKNYIDWASSLRDGKLSGRPQPIFGAATLLKESKSRKAVKKAPK